MRSDRVFMKIISITIPHLLEKSLNEECEKRQINKSELMRRAFLEFMLKYNCLEDYEKVFAETMLKHYKENMIEFIRSKNMKKMTIIRSIRNCIYRIRGGGNLLDRKDLINNFKLTLEICEIYDWKREAKIIKEMIKELKAKKIDKKRVEIFYTEAKKLSPEEREDIGEV
jgi:hypothetical protein